MPWRRLLPDRPTTPRVSVYLIHFGSKFGHAQHYVGSTTLEVRARLFRHVMERQGSKFLKKVLDAGITLHLAQVWPNVTTRFEYNLKGRGKAAICPICRGEVPLPAPLLSRETAYLPPKAEGARR
jgi:hypothetical protein